MNLFVESDLTFQLEKYCRLCAEYSEDNNFILISECTIVASTYAIPNTMNIPKILENSFDIRLNENSLLPTEICQKCLDSIISFFNFKTKCHESEERLKQIIRVKNIFSSDLFEEVIFDESALDEVDDEAVSGGDDQNGNEMNIESVNHETGDSLFFKHEFNCSDCGLGFMKKSQLQTHRKNCDKNIYKDPNYEGPYICRKCGKEFSSLTGYNVHKYMHFRQENGLNKRKSRTDSKRKDPHNTDMLVCYLCGKTFKQHGALKVHIQFHTKNKPFECTICNKRFYTKSSLKDHTNVHSEEKKFSCKECNKQFYTYRQLHKHSVIHKKDARKLQCSMCTRNFFYPYELQMHMMIHTGNKPHPCTLCDLKFRFPWELKNHTEKSHKTRPIDAAASTTAVTAGIDKIKKYFINNSESDIPVAVTDLKVSATSVELLEKTEIAVKSNNDVYYDYL